MVLTGGNGPVTSSYIDSMCVMLLPALFDSCSSKAIFFALLLIKIITITITEITTLTTRAVARELTDTIYTSVLTVEMPVFTVTESLILPVMFPQTTV